MDNPQMSSASLQSSHGGNNVIRAAIMAVVVVVSAGYLMLWVMMPTDVFSHTWLPKLRAQTASTYYGTKQGANYLVKTLPVLFIALLGCVYLHLLGKKSRDCRIKTSKDRLAILKRPMIIKGLGIVSCIELAFLVMFIALLVWSLATYLRVSFAKITPYSAEEKGEKVWEAKLGTAARRLGLVGNIALTFLFFPVTRGSSILPLFGLTSESSVKYHIWLGHIVMTLFTAHGLCYIIFWASTHQVAEEMLKWDNTGVSNVAGEIALLAGLILWAVTFPSIRRNMFELFFYTHHMYILFMFFFVLHVGISFACIMLPGFFLFMIDRYVRFLQSRRNVRLLSARVLPCETIELNFCKSKDLSYAPTSIMFMNVASISKLQWHPFTISSSSSLESDNLSVTIKKEGTWTDKLHQLVSSPSSIEHLCVSIEGPYGPASTDFLRHDRLVMISGGSGLTPFISIIRELIHSSETLKSKTPEVILISSVKNSNDLTMLDLILPITDIIPSKFSSMSLKIEAFVTREKQQPASNQEKKTIRTIWFKPNTSDTAITHVLGPKNWLWLGAIISSSFVIYLIFSGILTRYYIYPIDHNTNKIYSSSARAVLHILFLWIGIVIAATTVVFVWNKNKSGEKILQIQAMECTSPKSWCYNADRELESFPQQSLSESINVHYGERPNLKKYLFELKESNVGVLVCGPKKMRHEVANICSCGWATNLHFESISFSW